MMWAGINEIWSHGDCVEQTQSDNTSICVCHGVGFFSAMVQVSFVSF